VYTARERQATSKREKVNHQEIRLMQCTPLRDDALGGIATEKRITS
jgi:hypothetical protein